jgi:uncharacterized protein YbjT (DUF2867 family)
LEEGVDRRFQGAGVPLNLGEEKASLERGEKGDGEGVRVGAVRELPGLVQAAEIFRPALFLASHGSHCTRFLSLTTQFEDVIMSCITHFLLPGRFTVILVTTAGKVGAATARLLREQDVPVRVLVRNPDQATAKALAAAGAEIAAGDLDVPASIDAAMAGVSAVVLVSPAVPAQELHVVASAARTGVAHIVKATSKASADSPIARRRGQAEIEAGLAATGIPHTLLRSNAYMQNVLALAPAIAATSSFGSAAGKGRAGMVDARDVAAVAAAIAASPAPHNGKTYWLTGPELLSNYDVAAVLSRLLGRTITYRELTFEENKDAMIRAGVPEQIAQQNAQAFSLTADGDAEWVTDDILAILGRPARSFAQFAADHAAAF